MTTTIADILQEHGVEFKKHGDHHHTSRNWINVDCPFCSPRSHRWRMGLRPDRPGTHCWACGWHGTLETIRELIGCTDNEARRIVSVTRLARDMTIDTSQRKKRRKTRLPASVSRMGVGHRKYLRQRGFDPRVLSYRYDIQGIGLHSRLSWRLFIPVFNANRRLVTWTSRATSENAIKKYIAASVEESEVPIHDCLYGIELCDRDSIVVHEGPFDVWRTGPGSVALMGVDWTTAQLEQLAKFENRFVCLDIDELGRYRARRLTKELSAFPGTTTMLTLETANDIAEANQVEVESIREML